MKRRTFLGIGLTGLLSSLPFARAKTESKLIDLDQVIAYKPEFKLDSIETDELQISQKGWLTAYCKTLTGGFLPCRVFVKLSSYNSDRSSKFIKPGTIMGYSVIDDDLPINMSSYDLYFKIDQTIYVSRCKSGLRRTVRVIQDNHITYRD
jgi:hypothetical protein